jgi:predicted nucleic acid-binding protein
MRPVVSDASPLIVLAKANLLAPLPQLFSEVFLPQAVQDEILTGPPDDPMKKLLPSCSWLVPVKLSPPLSPLSVWQLGRGEAEVIEYARLHGNLPVLLDDRAGRRAAESLGLKVYGTLGLMAMAVKSGLISSFRDVADALKKAGLYVDDRIIEAVKKGLAS